MILNAKINRFQILQHVKPLIIEHLKSLNQNIFSVSEMQEILFENKTKWTLPKITTFDEFISFLKDKNVIKEIEVETPQRTIYIW